MVDKNLNEIYTDNPLTTLDDDNLLYALDDPSGTPTDGAIAKSDLFAQIESEIGGGGSSLTVNASTITTANLTCAEDNVYNCTIAGLTADRNAVLPAPTAAGKTIRINILDGDATYALVIIGDTGVTINGGSAATEWSRLFIAGETVTLESTSTSNWQVIEDGRKPCLCLMERQAAQSISNNTVTKVLLDTAVLDVGGMADVANSKVIPRRSNGYEITAFSSIGSITSGNQLVTYVFLDASAWNSNKNFASANVSVFGSGVVSKPKNLTTANYLELYIKHDIGTSQDTQASGVEPYLYIKEIL